jgi:hypothetical protein
MIFQLHWQRRDTGESYDGMKVQFEIFDDYDPDSAANILRENVRHAKEKFPIPEELQRDVLWMICNENSKHFQVGKDFGPAKPDKQNPPAPGS